VTGSNLVFSLDPFVCLSNLGFLSPNSRCFSFDSRGDGYARGEGVGVLIIKRIKDAIRDGDTIRAVIRSTGSNQDGRTPGVTQPNKDSQEKLIRDTYLKAGLVMHQTMFFESHGTGTAIGDPTEAAAIGAAFGRQHTPYHPLLM
jgi:acyl transferase domain-containing protein